MNTYFSNLEIYAGIVYVVVTIIILLNIMLFFKIWLACDDIRKMHNRLIESADDIRFWSRARYESEKRRGVIMESDIDIAEEFVEGDAKS